MRIKLVLEPVRENFSSISSVRVSHSIEIIYYHNNAYNLLCWIPVGAKIFLKIALVIMSALAVAMDANIGLVVTPATTLKIMKKLKK